MDATVSDIDEIMHKTGGEQRGRIYLGTEYEGVPVTIAVSKRQVGGGSWDDLETLLASADPEDVPQPVVDEMIGMLTRLDQEADDVDQEWSGLATTLTATPADEIPDEVLSAMRAKVTQADMTPSDD